MTRTALRTMIGLLAWCVVAGTVAGETNGVTGLRSWKTLSGSEVMAEFVAVKQGVLTLRQEDGKLLQIRPNALIVEDREIVRQLAAAASKDDEPGIAQGADNELPVFANGLGSGWNMVHQDARMVAKIDKNASIWIQPRENGKDVGKPLRYGFSISYYNTERKRYIGRPVVKFSTKPEPTLRPRKTKLEGMAKDGVRFWVEYSFNRNAILASGRAYDPDGIEYPSVFYLGCGIAKYIDIPHQMPMSEQRALLAGNVLSLKPPQGTVEEYDYWTSLSLGRPFKYAKINGPWSSREVTFTPPRKDNRYASVHNYSGMPLNEGYSVRLSAPAGTFTGMLRVCIE